MYQQHQSESTFYKYLSFSSFVRYSSSHIMGCITFVHLVGGEGMYESRAGVVAPALVGPAELRCAALLYCHQAVCVGHHVCLVVGGDGGGHGHTQYQGLVVLTLDDAVTMVTQECKHMVVTMTMDM